MTVNIADLFLSEPQKCPSCGGPPPDETDPSDLIHDRQGIGGGPLFQCECGCGLAGPTALTKAGAIAQWNMIRMVSPTELAATDPHMVRVGCRFGPDDESESCAVLVYGDAVALLPYQQQLAEIHPVGTLKAIDDGISTIRRLIYDGRRLVAERDKWRDTALGVEGVAIGESALGHDWDETGLLCTNCAYRCTGDFAESARCACLDILDRKPTEPTEGQERWLSELAKKCRCCVECGQLPCAGCQQGAACDDMPCLCGDSDDDECSYQEGDAATAVECGCHTCNEEMGLAAYEARNPIGGLV